MQAILRLCAVSIVILFVGVDVRGSVLTRPQVSKARPWPSTYQVSWLLDIPYIDRLQSTPIRYNYTTWQDEEHGLQLSTRDSVESVLQDVNKNIMWQIFPHIDKMDCRAMTIDGGAGPTMQASRRLLQTNGPQLTLVLPDLTDGKWESRGERQVPDGLHKDTLSDTFQWAIDEDRGYGLVKANYTFYVSKEGAPLMLNMWGINIYTGGHYDNYIVNYYDYREGPAPPGTFDKPAICPDKPEPEDAQTPHHKQAGIHAQIRRMLPNRHQGDQEYDAFVHKFGRRHRSLEEYHGRRQVFQDNARLIAEHNSGNSSHRLGVNHFADWTQEEWLAIMLPRHGRAGSGRSPPPHELRGVHEASVARHLLPATVDFRGTGADSPVKDQAACGSCWAFGSTASLETAYYRGTGKQLLLSEQQLMDCAWNADDKHSNTACMGGYQDLAFQWVLPKGGIASEEDYPYRGVTNFCNASVEPAATWSGGKYVEVLGGERELMEAIYTKGPMTVSVDAASPGFRFYKSGVFDYDKCHQKLDDLDHAVIVSGYGTTPDGQDYWLMKNTWSTWWGEQGYMQIARHGAHHDCGISAQPIYVELQDVA